MPSSLLQSVSSDPLLREYAQGAARAAIMPVADFLAPAVEVPAATGRFKIYSDKNRFRIPDAARSPGGAATLVTFGKTDGTFNCTPNALDFPVDVQAQSNEDAMAEFQDAADMGSMLAALAHEKKVIDAAIASAATTVTQPVGADEDPIKFMDQVALRVFKRAGFGSLLDIGILMGAGYWEWFKNHGKVQGKFVVGTGGNKGVGFAVPTLETLSGLFIGQPEVRTSLAVYDSAAQGVADARSFVLDKSCIVFGRLPKANRQDPSFMKTFRLRGKWMVPGTYMTADGRTEVAKMDWSEDVQITNSAAAEIISLPS